MATSEPGSLPAYQRVVIIGAGIVGNSVAYHLTQLGETEITLLDKGPLPNPGGSTGHASNFIFPVDHSKEMTALTKESAMCHKDLDVYLECGGIEVARSEQRMQELARRMVSAKTWGIEPTSLITPAEIKELVPFINEELLLGGFYTPGAGVVDSLRAATLMRERAVEAGMTLAANTEVIGLDVEHGQIRRVRTTKGDIEADRVVIACGCWSPRIARMAGANIPLTPAVHQMIDIGPVARFADARTLVDFPIVRDMDTNMYERQDGGGLEIGSYAHRPILIDADEIPSIEASALSPTELPFTQADFELQMEQALELMPDIVGDETVGVRYAINGLLSVTLDGLPLIGETPEVKGLWSAAAIWIKEGPGSGKTVAELMVHGESEIDIYDSNIARAYPHQKTKAHIQARASEGFNKMYGIVHPAEQWESDRRVKLSPYYERELELGATFFEAAGWERPQWYESNAPLLEEFGEGVTRREAEWESRWWSPIINAEHLALRDRAGFTDLTAFAIFDVTGPGALDVVQKVAMRQMDVAVGRVVYTPILLPAGGFKADLTIMRMDENVFRVVTGGSWGMSDLKWFADHLPADGSAQIHDRTNAFTTLGLWGPRARDILSSVTSGDVSHEGLPFGRWKAIEVGPLEVVVAPRISYVGDLGWELYVPIEQGARLWDIIAEAGLPHGAVPVGAGVYGSTGRLEKCYRAYGAELEGEYDVVEAGMAWGKVKDQDFVGKEAHVRQRSETPAATMCALTVDDHTSSSGVKRYMLGGEPILTGDGEPIADAKGRRSYVTSAGSGPSIGKYILLGYLPPEHATVGNQLQVQYMGEQYPVTVATNDSTSVFDPDDFPGSIVNILVCVKRVPLTGGKITLTEDAQAIQTRHLGFTVSPHEECGAEEAIRLVEQHGGSSTVLTLGPPEAEEQLRDMMAIGIDKGIHLVTDGGEWDPQATAAAIVAAITSEPEPFDLILFGNESADAGNYQVAIRVAQSLALPIVTGIKAIAREGDTGLRCEQETSAGRDVYVVPTPAVVSVKEGINLPRYPSVPGRMRAKRKPIAASEPARAEAKLKLVRLVLPEGTSKQAEILGRGAEAAPAVVEILQTIGVM